jgi:predicted acetyltransferase
MEVRLRPYRPDDEQVARAAHEAMKPDQFKFLLGIEDATTWSDFLSHLADTRQGRNLALGQVRATQLLAEVDGAVVGRSSIRFELNDWLAERGGHIGYCVLAPHRRRGYATEILRQSLIVARAEGVGPVLMVCDDENAGSARAIERCGGVLESVRLDQSGSGYRRYWIA